MSDTCTSSSAWSRCRASRVYASQPGEAVLKPRKRNGRFIMMYLRLSSSTETSSALKASA